MLHPIPTLPSRIGVRVGERVYPAVPVLLRGHEASLVMDHAPQVARDVRLLVDWEDGSLTELCARVRAIAGDGRIAHLDVSGIEGDWKPFLAYLGGSVS